jgi:LytR cell envelope-related transcriptional attenuator
VTTPGEDPPPSGGGGGQRPLRATERLHTVIAAAIAIVAVLLGILAINLLHKPASKGSSRNAAGHATAPASPAPITPSGIGPGGIGPGGAVTTSSASPSSASPSATGKAAVTTPPAGASPARPSAGSLPFAPVDVYNNSHIEGLAAAAAKQVRAAGFVVKTISGVPGMWSETTVYYDPPDAKAAQTLILLVPGVRRALPRPSWLLRTNTLILVVTKDFPLNASS